MTTSASIAPLRILVVDDHPYFRDGLESALRDHFQSADVDHAGTVEAVKHYLTDRRPIPNDDRDVVVLDVQLGGADGLDLIPEILERWPDCRVLVVSGTITPLLAARALHSGAVGFIGKDADGTNQMHVAVAMVMAGENYLPAHIRDDVSGPGGPFSFDRKLTAREKQVLIAQMSGLDVDEAAVALDVTVNTIRAHNRNIRRNWRLNKMHKVLALAHQLGYGTGRVKSK